MARMTNAQKIEASREVRLWFGQIVIPVAGVLMVFPEAREWARDKAVMIGEKAKKLFRK